MRKYMYMSHINMLLVPKCCVHMQFIEMQTE